MVVDRGGRAPGLFNGRVLVEGVFFLEGACEWCLPLFMLCVMAAFLESPRSTYSSLCRLMGTQVRRAL